jgi:16S rRNA (guanine527-N7)-methyltransferase
MTDREEFAASFDVPRGTMAKFDTFAAMLVDWQGRMNLVGPATLPMLWQRHLTDSAQLLRLGQPGAWLDMGAGAGFPGLVLALMGASPVHLVEATTKKCLFLQAVSAAVLDGETHVHNLRIESMPGFAVANITARACAKLSQLFSWGLKFATPETLWIFPKGSTVDDEVAGAKREFSFDHELVESMTDIRGRIVVARNVRRRS